MSLLTPSFGLLFWMVLSFAIVFGLLAKFGFPVITKMVDERRNYVQQSLATADEANRKLAGIKQESETILNEARVRQGELIKRASEEGDKLVAAAKEQAAAAAQRKLDDAQREIAAQKQKAMGDIRNQVAQLSVDIAEKILRKQLDNPKSQDALIAKLLDEVEQTGALKEG